jgi:iron complex transport system permease protein
MSRIYEAYSSFIARKILFLIFGSTVLIALVIFATSVGAANLSMLDVFSAIAARFFSVKTDFFKYAVVWHLRLPRVIMGVVAGAGLALSGAVMQGITRNPLVSPFTIGVSSAAAFGASVAIMIGVGFIGTGTLLIITNAFILALVCTFTVFGLARLRGTSPETLILAGIALSYFFSALTAILQFFASEEELMMMVHWTFGSLTRANWEAILIVTAVFIITLPVLMRFSWDLNAMVLADDETAKSLGVNTTFVRTVSLILSAFITATIICFTGIIGFVGLVAPHLTRFVIGGDHRFLLPASCISGAILIIAADTVGRTILPPIILPIGIVISFIGVPMFIYLLMTRKEEYWR